jgi:hypothetical protein
MDRTITLATIGDFTFLQGTWSDGSPVYSFLIGDTNGRPHEWYASLDMALIAAVGEKYTGPRGAGGPNVGTAADWFAKMIGMPAES